MGKKQMKKKTQRRIHLKETMTMLETIGYYMEENIQIQNHLGMKMNKKKNYQVLVFGSLVITFSVHAIFKIMNVTGKQLNFIL